MKSLDRTPRREESGEGRAEDERIVDFAQREEFKAVFGDLEKSAEVLKEAARALEKESRMDPLSPPA